MARLNPRVGFRRGTALVEAALVLPILFALLFGLIEYGWMFLKAEQVSLAARDGARAGSLADGTSDNITTAVANRMTQAGITSAQYTLAITPPPDTLTRGQTFVVTVSADYGQSSGGLSLLHIGLIPVPDRLHSSFTMAKEGP
jgi:Flp pilus assembly protein TadG